MAFKYYAVKKGRIPGVYHSWNECKAQVENFNNAVFKGFNDEEEAFRFAQVEKEIKDLPYIYIDGSYNPATKVYGYGGFLVYDNNKYIIQGSGNDDEMAKMRNVAGEVMGATNAIKKALELNIPEINLYYDYLGIEKWATKEWQAKKEGTKEYQNFHQTIKNKIKINFIKVKSHSKIEGNEEADKLAKESVGV